MKKALLITGCLLLLIFALLVWLVFLHKDISDRIVHGGGFNAPLVKIVFDGQQKTVELDDPESLVCIQRAVAKVHRGLFAAADYDARFYLANGEVDELAVMIDDKPAEISIYVYEKSKNIRFLDDPIGYANQDPVIYGAEFDQPLPPKLKSVIDLLVTESKLGSFKVN